MSEARALTNLIGTGVATIVVAKWEGELDENRMRQLVGETGESPKGREGKRAAAPTPEETRRQPSFRLPIAAGKKKADKQLPSPEPDAVSQARVGRKQRSYR